MRYTGFLSATSTAQRAGLLVGPGADAVERVAGRDAGAGRRLRWTEITYRNPRRQLAVWGPPAILPCSVLAALYETWSAARHHQIVPMPSRRADSVWLTHGDNNIFTQSAHGLVGSPAKNCQS